MTNLSEIKKNMALPAIGAPMFIASTPPLVTEQCKAGIIGSFPALNARPQEMLNDWLHEIKETLAAHDAGNPAQRSAPFAVNQIVHKSNVRLMDDLKVCVDHQAPIVICSLGAVKEVYDAVHSYGGIVLHDIINDKFAHKAIEKGADGLIAVAAGAGGHAGTLSPFALIQEIREWFDGPLALSGCIATGRAVLAAEAMGADFGYIGSPFLATQEANVTEAYKEGVVDGRADDIVYTNLFSGVHGNYLKASVRNAGMDPDNLPEGDLSTMNFGAAADGKDAKKVWKDIWGCGQGVGVIHEIRKTGDYVRALAADYHTARNALSA